MFDNNIVTVILRIACFHYNPIPNRIDSCTGFCSNINTVMEMGT